MTKTEARGWLKRMREDVRLMEVAIRNADHAAVYDLSLDISGAAEVLAAAHNTEEQ